MILEDLISTNILQRGIGNVNPMKMAKCIKELERIYGIKQGGKGFYGNQYYMESSNNFKTPTQESIAKNIGMTPQQLQNYKRLNNLIPELQDLVEDNSLKATTAYKIWAKMPKDEQEKFFNEIGKEKIKQMTKKQTEKYLIEKLGNNFPNQKTER